MSALVPPGLGLQPPQPGDDVGETAHNEPEARGFFSKSPRTLHRSESAARGLGAERQVASHAPLRVMAMLVDANATLHDPAPGDPGPGVLVSADAYGPPLPGQAGCPPQGSAGSPSEASGSIITAQGSGRRSPLGHEFPPTAEPSLRSTQRPTHRLSSSQPSFPSRPYPRRPSRENHLLAPSTSGGRQSVHDPRASTLSPYDGS